MRGKGVKGGEVGRTVTKVVQLSVCAAILKLYLVNREDARRWPAITVGMREEWKGGGDRSL